MSTRPNIPRITPEEEALIREFAESNSRKSEIVFKLMDEIDRLRKGLVAMTEGRVRIPREVLSYNDPNSTLIGNPDFEFKRIRDCWKGFAQRLLNNELDGQDEYVMHYSAELLPMPSIDSPEKQDEDKDKDKEASEPSCKLGKEPHDFKQVVLLNGSATVVCMRCSAVPPSLPGCPLCNVHLTSVDKIVETEIMYSSNRKICRDKSPLIRARPCSCILTDAQFETLKTEMQE